MPFRPLNETLAYRNEAVVLRFIETWDVPRAEADTLFEDTKQWLWLCARLAEEGGGTLLAITPSTKLLDEMWHTFILFTREYFEFCDAFLGRYIHHAPTARSEYDAMIAAYERDPDSHRATQQIELEEQIDLVYEMLGEDTASRWYGEYVEKYSETRIRSIWRWSFSPYDTRVRQSVRLPTSSTA